MAVDLGFVGLGAMGSGMVARLVHRGFRVAAYDVDAAALRAAGSRVVACDSARAVADLAPVVFVSLPTPEVVQHVACGRAGLLGGKAMSTYVDMSTTGPDVAQQVASTLSRAGVACVDAPVSGGAAGATSGTLTIMLAGDPSAIEAIRPALDVLGSTITVVGEEPGQAQVMKLANNMLSATAMVATSEAVAMGLSAGLRPETMLAVLNSSTGRNTATSHKFPEFVLSGSFQSGFRLALMKKDVGLFVVEAERLGTAHRVAGQVADVYAAAVDELEADADATQIATYIDASLGSTERALTERRDSE